MGSWPAGDGRGGVRVSGNDEARGQGGAGRRGGGNSGKAGNGGKGGGQPRRADGRSGGAGDRRDAAGRQRHRGGEGKARHYGQMAPAQRSRKADPARAAVFEVLRAVDTADAYANLALPAAIRRHRLDRRDAGLATELTYGTLRERGRLDAVISRCVDRPLDKVDPPVLDVLRLGAYQLLATRIPAHAALDATVALTRDLVGAGAGGFVNAVLRRISERSPQEWDDAIVEEAKDETERLAVLSSHPQWIVRALRQALAVHAGDAVDLPALLHADNAAPVVNLVALPGLADAIDLADAGAEPSPLVPGAWLHEAGGDPARLPGVAGGEVRVQDAGSQLVARALAGVALPDGGEDSRWLDMCAGPGGKAALLAAEAALRGAHLEANEVAEHRARLVEQALGAVAPEAVDVVVGDGRRYGKDEPASFDRIMLDAPCSGLGALRRRPEARWRKSAADIPALTTLQGELLDSGLDALRPGGVLAYVTCSPHPAETIAVIEDVLHRRKDVELLDTGVAVDAASVPGEVGATRPADAAVGSTTGSTVQLFPHRQGTDAMFMALLTRH